MRCPRADATDIDAAELGMFVQRDVAFAVRIDLAKVKAHSQRLAGIGREAIARDWVGRAN